MRSKKINIIFYLSPTLFITIGFHCFETVYYSVVHCSQYSITLSQHHFVENILSMPPMPNDRISSYFKDSVKMPKPVLHFHSIK